MALLAGLAAQVTPASARVCEDTQIGAAADARLLDRQCAVLANTAEARPLEALVPEAGIIEPVLEAQTPVHAQVLIVIDRARE